MSEKPNAKSDTSAPGGVIILENADVFDGVSSSLLEGFHVAVEGGLIREVSEGEISLANALRFDCTGLTLLPGLIDAHVHIMGSVADISRLNLTPASYDSCHAARMLKHALDSGFTTVRDVAGADGGTARAIEDGVITGPTLLYAGRALSMTGGHGDFRPADEGPAPCGCHLMNKLCHIVDGADSVRKAAREELRRGAHCIKIMLSGGVLSPTDPIWMDQFCDEEVMVAIEEAKRWRAYVAAHCHTPNAIQRCVRLGVRSIEHATLMDQATAAMVRDAEAYVVPTLAMAMAFTDVTNPMPLPDAILAKAKTIVGDYLASLELMDRNGLKIAFGTDLLGSLYAHQSREFLYRREVQDEISILRSATSVGAELLMRPDLGHVRPGGRADLILVRGNPLRDIGLLAAGGTHLAAVMKGGKFHKRLAP